MPVVGACAICDGPGEGCFFGAFSCRSCAAFFRRSVRDGRQYQCRANGDCSINEAGMRNSCRACRLQRCLQNGMSEMATKSPSSSRVVQRRSKKADHHHQQHEEGTSDSLPHINHSAPSAFSAPFTAVGPQHHTQQSAKTSSPLSVTICGKFFKSIANFNEVLTAICAQHFGSGIIVGDFEKKLNQNDCTRLDKLSAPLYLEFVRTHFPEFDSLLKSHKAELMHNFFIRFGFVHSFELTSNQLKKQHPPPNDNLDKFYLYPKCFVDGADNCDYFYDDVPGIGKERQKRMGQAMQKDSTDFLQSRYMPLTICPQEFAALTGILFWNTVKKTVEIPRISTQLEALFLELHQVIGQQQQAQANNSPPTASVARFGTLLTLLWDVTNMADKDLNDILTLSNLCLDPSSTGESTNIWENLL